MGKVIWTENETFYLVYGYLIHKDEKHLWSNILSEFRDKFHYVRTSVSLKDRWRNIQNLATFPGLKKKAQAKIDFEKKKVSVRYFI